MASTFGFKAENPEHVLLLLPPSMASTFGFKAENPEHVQLPSGEDIDNILDEIEQKEQAKPPNNANWDKIVQQTRIKNIGFIKNLFLSKEIDVNSQN
eukprot:564303_1